MESSCCWRADKSLGETGKGAELSDGGIRCPDRGERVGVHDDCVALFTESGTFDEAVLQGAQVAASISIESRATEGLMAGGVLWNLLSVSLGFVSSGQLPACTGGAGLKEDMIRVERVGWIGPAGSSAAACPAARC